MNNEYIIINKTAIQKRIVEWETELQECYKAPVGKFNSDYVSTLQQAIATAREIISQSTPLIPEIEKAFNNGFHKGYNVGQADAQCHPLALTIANHVHKDKQEYISNLKLDI